MPSSKGREDRPPRLAHARGAPAGHHSRRSQRAQRRGRPPHRRSRFRSRRDHRRPLRGTHPQHHRGAAPPAHGIRQGVRPAERHHGLDDGGTRARDGIHAPRAARSIARRFGRRGGLRRAHCGRGRRAHPLHSRPARADGEGPERERLSHRRADLGRIRPRLHPGLPVVSRRPGCAALRRPGGGEERPRGLRVRRARAGHHRRLLVPADGLPNVYVVDGGVPAWGRAARLWPGAMLRGPRGYDEGIAGAMPAGYDAAKAQVELLTPAALDERRKGPQPRW